MLLLFLTLFVAVVTGDKALSEESLAHLNNAELQEYLVKVHQKCPNITHIYELSQRSVNGWPLLVIEITRNPGKHEARK